MFARILLSLIAVCLSAQRLPAQEWNLFAANTVTAADRCLVEWDLFTPAALKSGANEECQAWNLFAESQPSVSPAAKHGERALLLLTTDSCPPCRECKATLKPKVEKAGWPVRVVRFEDDPHLFDELRVGEVPTWIAVMRGEECGRYTGKDGPKLYGMLRRANRAVLSRD